MTTPNRTGRRAIWTALPLSLALAGVLSFSPTLAQGAPTDATPNARARAEGAPRAGAFFLRRGADGGLAMRGMHVDPRAGDRREDAFARWLAADAEAGPVVPGLVGRVADGTTVRLVFYDGAPEEGGTELAALTYVAGEDDVAAFRTTVRTAAEDATYVVVDVLGRVVSLPEAAPASAAE